LTSSAHELCIADLTQIMTSSRNYAELLEAWKGWRDVTGPRMRNDYAKFVELSNKAVKELGIFIYWPDFFFRLALLDNNNVTFIF